MELEIVFFGSGPVAAQSLQLLKSHFRIEAIITKPTTLHEMRSCVDSSTPVYTVSNKKELDILMDTRQFRSSVAVLIDFGIIVSRKVISTFLYGIVNAHFSLLPEWRGADPITFAILSGQNMTGISLMLIDQGMDTGSLLAQANYTIPTNSTITELTSNLVQLSDEHLQTTLPRWLNDEITPIRQTEDTAPSTSISTYSRKLTKKDGILDFHKPATVLEREIRGFSQWPRSRTILAESDIIIVEATTSQIHYSDTIGDVFITSDKQIIIQCGVGSLTIQKLQPSGKKIMNTTAYLAGYGRKLHAKYL